jgi:hypothetical protein
MFTLLLRLNSQIFVIVLGSPVHNSLVIVHNRTKPLIAIENVIIKLITIKQVLFSVFSVDNTDWTPALLHLACCELGRVITQTLAECRLYQIFFRVLQLFFEIADDFFVASIVLLEFGDDLVFLSKNSFEFKFALFYGLADPI